MNKVITYILFVLVGMWSLASTISALEALSSDQMKSAVAQAGVQIAIRDAVTEAYSEGFTVFNTELGSEDQYMSLNGIHMLSSLDTGAHDMNGDGLIHHLSLDLGLFENQVMLFAESPDFNITSDITVDAIDFYGTNIGGLFIDNLELFSFHLYMGPHLGSGVDFEFGEQLHADSMTLGDNPDYELKFSGIAVAGSFSETVLENTDSWRAEGKFLIGNLAEGKAASIDISGDTVAGWEFEDGSGVDYFIENPRANTAYIAANLPFEGSIRVENIKFGNSDLGLLAIDGIKVEKLYIEIPGRGMGKP